MIELLKRRRTRKAAKEMLRHAKHLRNMRGDLMSEADTGRIESAEQTVREALRLGVVDRVDEATGALHEVLSQLTPSRRLGSFGENVEIVVVAIVVAVMIDVPRQAGRRVFTEIEVNRILARIQLNAVNAVVAW